MAGRVLVGLIALGSIIGGLAGEAFLGGEGNLTLVLVILGLAYAVVAIDAEDATGYLVLALAVGGAGMGMGEGAGSAQWYPGDRRNIGYDRRSGRCLTVCRCGGRTRAEDGQSLEGLRKEYLLGVTTP